MMDDLYIKANPPDIPDGVYTPIPETAKITWGGRCWNYPRRKTMENDGAQWVTLLAAMMLGTLVCMALGMGAYHMFAWLKGRIHRYKTRRQSYKW